MPPAVLQVVASGVVDKYIGESARVIREMFRCGADRAAHDPCELPVARGGSVVGHGHVVSADVRVDSRYFGLASCKQQHGWEHTCRTIDPPPRCSYAREHEPCIIFMDEIDAIGGKRFSEGTSADREVRCSGGQQTGWRCTAASLLHVCSACCGTRCLRDWLLKPSMRPQLCCRRCNER